MFEAQDTLIIQLQCDRLWKNISEALPVVLNDDLIISGENKISFYSKTKSFLLKNSL